MWPGGEREGRHQGPWALCAIWVRANSQSVNAAQGGRACWVGSWAEGMPGGNCTVQGLCEGGRVLTRSEVLLMFHFTFSRVFSCSCHITFRSWPVEPQSPELSILQRCGCELLLNTARGHPAPPCVLLNLRTTLELMPHRWHASWQF